jgi:hypothetical protein
MVRGIRQPKARTAPSVPLRPTPTATPPSASLAHPRQLRLGRNRAKSTPLAGAHNPAQ